MPMRNTPKKIIKRKSGQLELPLKISKTKRTNNLENSLKIFLQTKTPKKRNDILKERIKKIIKEYSIKPNKTSLLKLRNQLSLQIKNTQKAIQDHIYLNSTQENAAKNLIEKLRNQLTIINVLFEVRSEKIVLEKIQKEIKQ